VVHWVKIFPPQPIADFVPDPVSGCVPLFVSMTNNSMYGEEYLWEFDDGSTSTDFEPTHTYTEAGYYQVKLTVTGEGGVDYAFREIEVFELPELDFIVEPLLVMLPAEPVKSFNLSKYGTEYRWDFGDGTTYDIKDTIHQYTAVGVYDVSLTGWTEHGCEAILIRPEYVTVLGEGSIEFPDAFSPNLTGAPGGDYSVNNRGNDVFHPVHEGIKTYKLSIYNRWGARLFYTENINEGWDGYHKENLCAQGVYLWRVEVVYQNGIPKTHVGNITLLHNPD